MIKSFLNDGSVGYEFGNEDSWSERGMSVVEGMREYPTYGDGTVKHGPSFKVPVEHFVDCLISLYDYLAAGINGTPSTRTETMKRVESYWPQSCNPGDKLIAFFASVKFTNGKRRFFSRDEMKFSASESKQYDKRWEEIPAWADGSFDATWRFVRETKAWDYAGTFHQFEMVKEWFDNNHGYGFANTYERNGIGTDTLYNDVSSAYNLVNRIVSAYRETENAKRSRESLQWNLVGRHEQEKAA